MPHPAGQVTGTITTYNQSGNTVAGAGVTIALITGPGTTGAALDGEPVTYTSDASGNLTVTLIGSTVYNAVSENGLQASFTTPASGSFTLPEIVGLSN